jgi:glutathione S-transferase
LTVNDSLSICEFLAERFPDRPLWPRDWKLRALARSAAAEMHAGFPNIRNDFSTNFIAKYTGNIPLSDKARAEIARLMTLWAESRRVTVQRLRELGQEDQDSGFLFGKFGIADAFYWPVLWVSSIP